MQRSIIKFVKNHLPVLRLIFITVFIASCSSTSNETTSIGNWSKVTPFKGRPRSGAIYFTIGTKAYVGLGYDGDQYISDFYSYDLSAGYWETKKAFPGDLRERAVAFSADGKGYVGLGYNRDQDKEQLGDFWQYDPDQDEWLRVADFAGSARYNAVGFSIGSKAYVGTGYDGDKYNSDFWEFDIANNVWKEIVSYPGEKIEAGSSFVVNNKGYVIAGRNNGLYNLDFWEFDPESLAWTKRSPASDATDYGDFKLAAYRHDAMVMVVDTRAYIVGGISSSGAVDNSVYEFDASTNTWSLRTAFEGSARSLAVAYSLNGRLFVGTGQNGSSRYDDIWEFKPAEAYDSSN